MTDSEKLDLILYQLKEIYGIVNVLKHWTEELDAKFDGLLNTTATKDSVAKLHDEIRILREEFQSHTHVTEPIRKAK